VSEREDRRSDEKAELLQLLAGRSVHELNAVEDARYIELLTRELEAIDGSDQRLLEELARGGHPIAGEDETGKIVVKRGKP
jgi:hypothetical protein